jgi:hypothetical protein
VDDGEQFPEKIVRLTKALDGEFAESLRLQTEIRRNFGLFSDGT